MKKLLPLLALSVPFAAQATTLNGFDATAYGFVKASAMYSTQGLASYNNINMSAPTNAAGRLPGRPQDKYSRFGTQTQQSRLGFNLKKGDNLSAKLEFDFIDFNKSSPTTQMVPRVRIAAVTYAWDNQKIVIGQDWDLFSPTGSYTFDYVGLFFGAGNTGFMRQQAQYITTHGDLELGAALGMAGNNPTAADTNLETAKSPSYSARASYKISPKGRVGVSAIYARLKFEQPGDNPTKFHDHSTIHDSYGTNAFYENVWDKFEIKSEAYYGQNMNNIGTLAIGKGTSSSNVKEYGAHLTGYYRLIDRHAIFGGVGTARVDNRTSVTPLAVSTNNNLGVITQPGIRANFLSRVGWEFKVTEDFSWLAEVSRYETSSRISINQNQTNVAYGLETGIQLRF
jgi:hypothetical protein